MGDHHHPGSRVRSSFPTSTTEQTGHGLQKPLLHASPGARLWDRRCSCLNWNTICFCRCRSDGNASLYPRSPHGVFSAVDALASRDCWIRVNWTGISLNEAWRGASATSGRHRNTLLLLLDIQGQRAFPTLIIKLFNLNSATWETVSGRKAPAARYLMP